jgi:hypothetical protein
MRGWRERTAATATAAQQKSIHSLAAGDEVVIRPSDKVADGVTISVRARR